MFIKHALSQLYHMCRAGLRIAVQSRSQGTKVPDLSTFDSNP